MDRQAFVGEPHDGAVFKFRRDLQAVGQAVAIDNQRMVARGLEGCRQSGEHACSGVVHIAHLAMHNFRMAHHFAAKGLSNGLMAQTHTHKRGFCLGRRFGQRKADARLIRVTGAGREQDRRGVHRHRLLHIQRIVAAHHHIRAQFTQVMDEIVGEAIVVIYQKKHSDYVSGLAEGRLVAVYMRRHARWRQGYKPDRVSRKARLQAQRAEEQGMARGFLSGAVWGVVVTGLGAGALSLSTKLPDDVPVSAVTPAPEQGLAAPDTSTALVPDAVEPEAAEPSEPAATDATVSEEPPRQPVGREVAATPSPAPAGPADSSQPGRRPAPETEVELPTASSEDLTTPDAPDAVGADTDTAAKPSEVDAPDVTSDIETETGAIVASGTDTPPTPSTVTSTPDAPSAGTLPVISTDTAQPPVPPVPEIGTALIEEAPQAPAPDLPDVQDKPEQVALATPEPAPAQEPVPEVDTETGPAPKPEPKPLIVAKPSQESSDRPTIGKPATPLFERAGNTAKLPRIGEPRVVDQASADVGETPLAQFAASSDADPSLPQIAIVLIDDGTTPWGPEALDGFPVPVSVAIPPSHPDVRGTVEGYRALGIEVFALAGFPDGAQPTDIEVTLAGTLAAVPQAVGVLESPSASLQASRAVSDQVAAYLAESGHGLVMQPKGLNTAQQLAAKAGVPSATLFRDFDGEGQDAGAIRRILDQSAFRARQVGAVVMMGRLQAETVSALVLWGLQDRNANIALVPVSAVLLGEQG